MSDTQPGLVVLVSGRGRNLEALIQAIRSGSLPVDLRAVISNRGDAYGLTRAERAGIPTRILRPRSYSDREFFDQALATIIDEYNPTLVALAGYMRLLSSGFVQQFAGRLVNIHPSLLPRHPGLETHRRALEAGDARHGATVHIVTEEMDAGPGVLQGSVAVADNETPEHLAERVMSQVETRIYPQALRWLATGRARCVNGQVELDGKTLEVAAHVDCDSEQTHS